MTLPSIPAASLSLNQVNVELGFGGSTTISLQDTAVRSLFAKTTVSSSISFSDGSNQTNIKYTGISPYSALANNDGFYGAYLDISGDTAMNFQANGQVTIAEGNIGGTAAFNRWGVSGITGGNFYIRFTRTATGGAGGGANSTNSTGWLQLNTARLIGVSLLSPYSGSATYTIEISNNASGSTILTTRTGILLDLFYEGGGG
jgi:hypothetical protein